MFFNDEISSRWSGPFRLTCKDSKLSLIDQKPRRVISRDELLVEVWGIYRGKFKKR